MNFDQIMLKITQIINETFESNYVIDVTTSADSIEEWDSITHIVLIANIEKNFKIKLGLGELQELKNVGEMAKLITSKLA